MQTILIAPRLRCIRASQNAAHARGFTLIELMVVVAVVSILAALAYPSYRESIDKSRRAEARAQLMDAVQYMQRFYSQNDRYDQSNAATPVATALPAAMQVSPAGSASGKQLYDIGFVAGSLTATAFVLQAVPRTGSAMAGDKCGSLQISSVGKRSATGTGATMDKCWR